MARTTAPQVVSGRRGTDNFELHVPLRKDHKKDVVSIDTTPPLPLAVRMALADCSREVKQEPAALASGGSTMTLS